MSLSILPAFPSAYRNPRILSISTKKDSSTSLTQGVSRMRLRRFNFSPLVLFIAFALSATSALAAPSISSVSPPLGPVGTSVTIAGQNFGATQGSSTVKFGTVVATPTSWSDTQIVVPVPSAAPAGGTNIFVTTAAGVSNGAAFLVGFNPLISSVSPQLGPVGTAVTIAGLRFGATQGSSTVAFGTIVTTPTSWSDTQIVVPVPTGAPNGGTQIYVTTSAGGSNGAFFTVGALPTITAISPPLGPVGTVVRIAGTRFGATQGSSTVAFGSVVAAPTSWSDTQIVVPVPSGAATGATNIRVTTAVGTGNGAAFLVGSNPLVSSVSPQQGASGTPVTLAGLRFGATQGSSTVKFGTVVATPASWSDTQIVVPVPSAAPGGGTQIYVTTSAGGSNGNFFNVTTPTITSLSPTSGSVGRSVTIAGTNFGASQGTSTVKFNGTAASVTAWSASSITATVPSGATTGNVIVTVGSASSSGVNFTVIAPPTITASAFPPPNASGWNTTNVYVNFTCMAGALPIATCPAQQVVSTDGANQIVTGTATDNSGNSASASVTLNVERTPPALAISAPVDQAVSTSSTLSVAGTSTNSVTNVNSVTCNGASAATSAGAFSCNLSLNPGVNLVMIRATDTAGNVSAVRLHVSYAAALPPPASVQIGPASANVLVGGTQQFTAVDDLGRPRTDATWTVDNTSVATITTDSSPTLTGVAAGTVTLTANVGGISAQIQVNILAGTSFPVGTVLWSAPTTAGFAVQQIAQAVPTANGPDLYSVEAGSNNNSLVRALTSDGRPMWAAQISGNTVRGLSATPDGTGGLVVHITPQTGLDRFIDLDGQSGATVWEYDDAQGLGGRKLAVGTDSTLYLTEATFSANPQVVNSITEQLSLIGLDPSSGAVRFLYPVPLSSQTNGATTITPDYRVGPISAVSQPIIGPDGSLFAETLVVHQTVNASYNQTLSLLQSTPGGATTLTTVAEIDQSSGAAPLIAPLGLIPDGSGGTFASWSTNTFPSNTNVNHISHLTSGGVTDFAPSFQNQILPNGMVLGENNTLFATDGGSILSLSPSFALNWSYQAANSVSLIASTADGGLVAKTTDQNALDTILRLDSAGVPTRDPWTASALDWLVSGEWFGYLQGTNTPTVFSASAVPWSSSIWSAPAQQGTNQPVAKIKLSVTKIIEANVPDASITESVNAGISYWQTKARLLLDWDHSIGQASACRNGVGSCAIVNDPTSMFDPVFDSTGSGNLTINTARVRFETEKGLSIVYTDAVSAAGIFAQGYTLSHPSVHPNSPNAPARVFENVVFVSTYSAYEGYDSIPHELGHTFQLEHVVNPINLMCGSIGSLVDFLVPCRTSIMTELNSNQVETARGSSFKWQQ